MTLDQEKIPYTYVRDEEIRAGKLRDQFDLILFGENYQDVKTQIHGIDTKFGPMPYTKTAEFTHHGVPVASDDITGGIGWTGMANLAQFLEEGGLLVTLGNGSALPLEGGLVRNVRRGSRSYVTGSRNRNKVSSITIIRLRMVIRKQLLFFASLIKFIRCALPIGDGL